MQKQNLTIKYLPVEDLIPYARNTRTHTPEQVNKVASSIKEFGFTNPVLVDAEKGIIAGHCRVMASQKLGMQQVPTIEVTGWTDAQKRAYIIADNKLALDAGWDEELLRIELEELKNDSFDIELTGFELSEIDEILGSEESQEFEESEQPLGSLSEKYLEPPFSILDSTSGRWVERVRLWKSLGLKRDRKSVV